MTKTETITKDEKSETSHVKACPNVVYENGDKHSFHPKLSIESNEKKKNRKGNARKTDQKILLEGKFDKKYVSELNSEDDYYYWDSKGHPENSSIETLGKFNKTNNQQIGKSDYLGNLDDSPSSSFITYDFNGKGKYLSGSDILYTLKEGCELTSEDKKKMEAIELEVSKTKEFDGLLKLGGKRSSRRKSKKSKKSKKPKKKSLKRRRTSKK